VGERRARCSPRSHVLSRFQQVGPDHRDACSTATSDHARAAGVRAREPLRRHHRPRLSTRAPRASRSSGAYSESIRHRGRYSALSYSECAGGNHGPTANSLCDADRAGAASPLAAENGRLRSERMASRAAAGAAGLRPPICRGTIRSRRGRSTPADVDGFRIRRSFSEAARRSSAESGSVMRRSGSRARSASRLEP